MNHCSVWRMAFLGTCNIHLHITSLRLWIRMENEKNYSISTGLCICFYLFHFVLIYASDVLRQFQLLAKNATVYSSIVYIVVYIVDVQISTKETHDSCVLQCGHCLFDIFYNFFKKKKFDICVQLCIT